MMQKWMWNEPQIHRAQTGIENGIFKVPDYLAVGFSVLSIAKN